MSHHDLDGKASTGKQKESMEYSDVHFELAKTSRAACAECRVTIDKGELKISKEVNSQNGKIVKSFHPKCALHLKLTDDNRSKCQSCKEKLVKGDVQVKVGQTCKTGFGSKHHYTCLFSKGANEGHAEELQGMLSEMQKNLAPAEVIKPVTTPVKKVMKPAEVLKPKAVRKSVTVNDDDDEEEDEGDEGDEGDDDDYDDDIIPARKSVKREHVKSTATRKCATPVNYNENDDEEEDDDDYHEDSRSDDSVKVESYKNEINDGHEVKKGTPEKTRKRVKSA